MGNMDVSKPDNDGERELIDSAVKALEAELATKTCNKQITSKLEDAELARYSEETCNNKQVSCKLVASQDAISRESVKELYFKDGYIDFHKICELPPVAPKHKVGKWISHMETWPTSWYRCSICGGEEERTSNYCPKCGTRMVPQEKQCADCNHYGKLSLDCGRCDDDCSMFEPQESEGV